VRAGPCFITSEDKPKEEIMQDDLYDTRPGANGENFDPLYGQQLDYWGRQRLIGNFGSGTSRPRYRSRESRQYADYEYRLAGQALHYAFTRVSAGRLVIGIIGFLVFLFVVVPFLGGLVFGY
jgi:hypothetical protein